MLKNWQYLIVEVIACLMMARGWYGFKQICTDFFIIVVSLVYDIFCFCHFDRREKSHKVSRQQCVLPSVISPFGRNDKIVIETL
jgi:hypothetical protein